MAFQPAPNVASVEIRFLQDSQRVENTLYARLNGPVGAGEVEALAEAVRQSWIDFALPLQHSSVQLVSVYAKSLASAVAPSYESFPANVQLGGTAGDQMPNNVSWCVKFTTGLSGRSGRGRNFIVGIARGQVSANVLTQVT